MKADEITAGNSRKGYYLAAPSRRRTLISNRWAEGKHMLRRVLIINVILLALIVEITAANDAPINLMSGSASPILRPKMYVRMVSEIVKIDLNDSTYVVDAEFTFYSNATDVESISVGFPKRSAGYLDDKYRFTDDFVKFEAWVNGIKTEVKEIADRSTLTSSTSIQDLLKVIRKGDAEISSSSIYASESKWMVRDVKFQPKEKTVTRVRYEARYQGGQCFGARYIFGTGSYWEGTIGNSKFIITCNAKDGCWDQMQDRGNGTKYKASRIEIKKNKTVEYQMIDFEPDEDDQIFMTVGCPD